MHKGTEPLTGILLAAGMGTRLKDLTTDKPKALVTVAGRPLFMYALDFLRAAGAKHLVVVVGSHAAEVRAQVLAYAPDVTIYENPHFAGTGNLLTLRAALPALNGSFLMVNVDHIYAPPIPEVVARQRTDGIVAFVDHDRPLGDDDMKVWAVGDRLERISKKLTEWNAGYVGMTYVDAAALPAYRRAVAAVAEVRGDQAAVEEVLGQIAATGGEVTLGNISGVGWYEVDTPEERARAEAGIAADPRFPNMPRRPAEVSMAAGSIHVSLRPGVDGAAAEPLVRWLAAQPQVAAAAFGAAALPPAGPIPLSIHRPATGGKAKATDLTPRVLSGKISPLTQTGAMNILITGGTGFQGTHLAEALVARGHTVTALNTLTPTAEQNAPLLAGVAEVMWGSITDPEVVQKAMRNKDVVFHLGARINVDESIEDPWGTIDVNVRGTYNILEAVRKTGARMIHTSTCEVYGTPEQVPIPEHAEMRPHSPYAASKAAADRLCYAYAQTYKIPVTILRFFNVYGERQKEGKFGAVIPIFVSQAMKGGPITVFGSGSQTRDYIHISDVIRAYLTVLDHPELSGEVLNFGTGVGTSIRQIADQVSALFGVQAIYGEARPGEASEMISDSTKVKRLLNWEPQMTFAQGLERYITWRKNQPRA